MRKVLVTGGAGYIGAHVCKELLESGHEVRIIDDFSTGSRIRLSKLNVEIFEGDILDREVLFRAVEGVDSVIHLAAKKSVEESVRNPLQYFSVNFCGTLNVLSVMASLGVKRIVFSSTSVVYASTDQQTYSENDPKSFLSPYASSKYLAEELIALCFQAEQISSVTLRYFNVVGASGSNMGDSARDSLVPKTFRALRRGDSPVIFGDDYETRDGTCVRDYIHVSDIAKAHQLALNYLFEKNKGVKVFNVGSGTGYTVIEMMNQMRESSGINFEARIMPRRAGDPERLVADISKIQKELGWSPTSTLKEMIDSAWLAG